MRFALDDGFFSPLDTNEAMPSIYERCRCAANGRMPRASQLDLDIDEFLNTEAAQPILFAPISTPQPRFDLRPACEETCGHTSTIENAEDAHEHVDWLRYTVRRMRRQ